MSESPITDLLAEIAHLEGEVNDERQHEGDPRAIADLFNDLVGKYRDLAKMLSIRAYPIETDHCRLEQVVVTVHGVDLSIRGRADDLFVHIDSSDRDADDRKHFPLAVDVNDTGEVAYGEGM